MPLHLFDVPVYRATGLEDLPVLRGVAARPRLQARAKNENAREEAEREPATVSNKAAKVLHEVGIRMKR